MDEVHDFAVYGRPAPVHFPDGARGWHSALSVGAGQALLITAHFAGQSALDPDYRGPRARLSLGGQELEHLSAAGGADHVMAHHLDIFAFPDTEPEAVDLTVYQIGGDAITRRLSRL
jgi:hypothetical protein